MADIPTTGLSPQAEIAGDYLDRTLHLRDPETGGHTERVAAVAMAVAFACGLPKHEARAIYFGAALHDIGKLLIPDAVLKKRGAYDADDRSVMQAHCQSGFDILARRYTRDAALVAYCHHERHDGTGYPRGLSGADIPLPAAICAIADYYDAASSIHGGRARLKPAEAVAELVRQRETWFAAKPIDAFVKAYEARRFG